MPRVTFVKSARKAVPNHGIAVGDSYYWWAFRVGGRGSIKKYSKTPPKRAQLTMSSFLQTIYGIEDEIAALTAGPDLVDVIENLAQQLRDLGEECRGSLDNMPNGLREGDTGQLLQERIDMCENTADELESIKTDVDSHIDQKAEDETEEEAEKRVQEEAETFWNSVLDEVQRVSLDC